MNSSIENILNMQIDMEQLFKFVENFSKDENKMVEMVDEYEYGEKGYNPLTKVIKETKNGSIEHTINIRYDLVKTLLATLFTTDYETDVSNNVGANLVFNTLVKNKILVEN